MDVVMDGEACAVDATGCANLAELVAAAEALDPGAEARVVVSVEIDGEPLPPEAMAELEQRRLDGTRRVVIERRPAVELARSVLAQGADYTTQITAAIAQSVDHHRAGRRDLGSSVLASVIDSLTVLTGITYSVSNVLADEARVLADLQGEIAPWLEALFEAQKSEDPIAIADVLEYEVSPRIGEWGETMRRLVGEKPIESEGAGVAAD